MTALKNDTPKLVVPQSLRPMLWIFVLCALFGLMSLWMSLTAKEGFRVFVGALGFVFFGGGSVAVCFSSLFKVLKLSFYADRLVYRTLMGTKTYIWTEIETIDIVEQGSGLGLKNRFVGLKYRADTGKRRRFRAYGTDVLISNAFALSVDELAAIMQRFHQNALDAENRDD